MIDSCTEPDLEINHIFNISWRLADRYTFNKSDWARAHIYSRACTKRSPSLKQNLLQMRYQYVTKCRSSACMYICMYVFITSILQRAYNFYVRYDKNKGNSKKLLTEYTT